jgi:hypothetical protein
MLLNEMVLNILVTVLDFGELKIESVNILKK